MSLKYNLPIELVRLQWNLLSVRPHREEDYKAYVPEAFAELKDRDRCSCGRTGEIAVIANLVQ